MTSGWVLSSSRELNIVEWEEDFSVYNPVSGETHVVNIFPAEILIFIQKYSQIQNPVNITQICQNIAELSGESVTPQLELRIKFVLQQLEDIDLIEYVQ